jgi:hypothetical protein
MLLKSVVISTKKNNGVTRMKIYNRGGRKSFSSKWPVLGMLQAGNHEMEQAITVLCSKNRKKKTNRNGR